MSNEKLSRRQRAKLRAEQSSAHIVVPQEKSLFSLTSNNPNISLNIFEQLMKVFSQDAQLSKIVSGNTTVATCLDIIAMKVATIPLNLYKQQRDGTFIPVKGKRFTDHIFSKPNASDTQTTFLYKLLLYFLTYGNAYLIKANNQLFVLPPTKVFPNKVGGTIQDYKVVLDNNLSESINIPPRLVCQIFKPSLDNTYSSAVKNSLTEIFLNSELLDRVASHVKSGMMAKGYLQQDKDASASLSQTQMSQLARQFTEATSGDKASATIVIPKGISYQVIAQTLADSASVEFEKVSRQQIVRAFKIPESLFNSEAGASFATANIQEINFYKNTIKPICILIEGFLNYWSEVTNETEYFRFELGDLISAEEEKARAETKKINADTAQVLNSLKLYSANEVREASGHDDIVDINENPIPDANVNPFELGTFTSDNQNLNEPVDPNAIVKKIEIVGKAQKCVSGCKCGK